MKKNLFGWLAMATMLVGTGCSSDDVVNDYSPENAIQFGTYVGRDAQSRGSVITTNGGENSAGLESSSLENFGVFAYYTNDAGLNLNTLTTSPNFMNNQKVEKITYSSGTHNLAYSNGWKYEPIKFWPNESTDKLSFFAYAPYETKTWNGAHIDIEIAEDVTTQKDYLVAKTDNTIDLNKQTVNGKVEFVFQHALSRVGFKVEAVIDEKNGQSDGENPDEDNEDNPIVTSQTTITVQEVELIGNFYKTAKLNLYTGTWNYVGSTSTASYSLDASDFTDVPYEVTTVKTELNKDTEYMMLIPKKFEGEDKIKIRVKYKVTTEDIQLNADKSEIENDITSDPFEFEFKQGNAYDFVLHLGLTSVKLSATVSDWTEQDVVANVPMNK